MKYALLAFSAVLLLGFFPSALAATVVRPAGTARTIIRGDFSDLILAEKQIQKSQAKIDSSKRQLERDVLDQNNRNSFRNVIVKNEDIIAAYRAEALDDIQVLRSHWDGLTGKQRDQVSEATVDLD